MSGRTFEFVIRRDSSYPESRDALIARLRALLERYPRGVPDERTTCFLRGFLLALVVGKIIGHADADDLKAMLPEMPARVRRRHPIWAR